VTRRESLMVTYLRTMVADDDGALEILDSLSGTVRKWLEEVADLAAGGAE
jgi:hypothetical protein